MKIKFYNWAYLEGASAAGQGWTGANPYQGTIHSDQWRNGYVDAVAGNLKNGYDALPSVERAA